MVNELVSVLTDNPALWAAPVLRKKSEITETILLSTHLYKVKDRGILDPKEYILTPTFLHYANVESPDIIRGSLRLGWTFVRFLEGQSSAKLEEAAHTKTRFRAFAGSASKRDKESNEEGLFSRQNSSPHHPDQASPRKDAATVRDATLMKSILKASVLRSSGIKPKIQLSVDPTVSASVQNKFQIFRFEQGVLFTEIGTYIPDVARKMREALTPLMVHKNFREEVSVLESVLMTSSMKLYCGQLNKTNQRCMIKSYPKSYLKQDPESVGSLKSQILILRELIGFNTSQLKQVYEDENSVYLIVDLVLGPTVEQMCKFGNTMKDAEIRSFLKDSLELLQVLKSKNIAHRKLSTQALRLKDNGKPSPQNHVILSDFSGATRTHEKNSLAKRVGALGFTAPEILNSYDVECIDFFKADMFSLGAVAYSLMAGESLYEYRTDKELFLCGKLHVLRPPNDKFLKFSEDIRNLVLKLLCRDPTHRPDPLEALNSKAFEVSPTLPSKNIFKSSVNKLMFINHLFEIGKNKPTKTKDKPTPLEGSIDSDIKIQAEANSPLLGNKSLMIGQKSQNDLHVNLRARSSNYEAEAATPSDSKTKMILLQMETHRRQISEGSKSNRPLSISMKKNHLANLNSERLNLFEVEDKNHIDLKFSLKEELREPPKLRIRCSKQPKLLNQNNHC